MLVKLFRCRSVFFQFPKRLLRQETLSSEARCVLFENKSLGFSRRLLSTTSLKRNGKPVIYSADDLVKNPALSSGLTPPTSSVDPITGEIIDPSFVDLGLATSWWPSHIIEGWFESFHVSTGFSWIATIAIGTAVLRLLLLPSFIASRKTTLRMSLHGVELGELRENMVDAMSTRNIYERLAANKKYRDFVKKNKLGSSRIGNILSTINCNHLTVVTVLSTFCIQPLVFISCLRAITEMSGVPVPSMAATSFLWISNLADPDPYRLLPAISGALIGLNIYSAVKLNKSITSPFLNKYVGLIAIAPVALFPIFFVNYSSAFGIYFVTNSLFTVAITFALLNKRIQQVLKMPEPMLRKDGKGGIMGNFLKDALQTSRAKTDKKVEAREIRRMLKDEEKQRKKELKETPYSYYEIGTEAKLKEEYVPDFQKNWKPPRPDIFKV